MAEPAKYVNVIDRTTGKMHHVRAEDLAEAEKDGLKPATAQEVAQHAAQAQYGGPGGMAAGAAIGIGQAATLGFGVGAVADVAEAIDPDAGAAVREYAEGVRAANPNITTGTEVAATLGLVAASGGGAAALRGGTAAARGGAAMRALSAPTRAVMRSGAALERGLGGGLRGLAARGVAEGAVYEAGQAYTEAALGNEQLTGEKLAAAMGHGAMLGGGMGLALAGAARGMERGLGASKRLMSRALAKPRAGDLEAVQRAAHGHAPKGFGAMIAKGQSLVSGVDEKIVAPLMELTGRGTATRRAAMTLDDTIASVKRGVRDNLDDVLADMNTLRGGTIDAKLSSAGNAIPEGAAARATAQSRQIIAEARAKVDNMIARGQVEFGRQNRLPDFRKRLDLFESRIVEAGDDARKVFAEMDQLKRTIGDDRAFMESTRKGALKHTDRATAKVVGDIYESFRAGLEDTRVWGGAAEIQRAINAPWSEQIGTTKNFVGRFTSHESGTWGKKYAVASDSKVGAYIDGLLDPETDRAHSTFVAWLDDSEKFANAAKSLDLTPAQRAAAERLSKNSPKLRKMLQDAEQPLTLRNSLAAADAADKQGNLVAGLMGAAIATGSPLGAVAAGAAGVFTSPGRTIRRLAALERMAGSIDNKIAGSVKGLFKRASRGAAVHAHRPVHAAKRYANSREEYEKRSASVREYALNRPAVEAQLHDSVAPLADTAPMAAQAAVATALRAQDYLQRHLPTGDLPSTMFGSAPRVSKFEAEKWLRRARAVEDPASVLDDLGKGKLSRDAVHAIKNVYPAIYQDMQAQVMDEVQDMREMGKQLPYRDRMQLGILFEVPVDPTLQPALVQLLQQGYATGPQGSEGQARGGRVTEAPDVSDVYQSASERVERDD